MQHVQQTAAVDSCICCPARHGVLTNKGAFRQQHSVTCCTRRIAFLSIFSSFAALGIAQQPSYRTGHHITPCVHQTCCVYSSSQHANSSSHLLPLPLPIKLSLHFHYRGFLSARAWPPAPHMCMHAAMAQLRSCTFLTSPRPWCAVLTCGHGHACGPLCGS